MRNKIEKLLKLGIKFFLFILPWQTVYIWQEVFVQGSKWEYGTLVFFASEILLWGCVVVFMVWYWDKYKTKDRRSKIVFAWTGDRKILSLLLLFVIYCFITIFWSINKDIALQQSLHLMEAGLVFVIIYLGPLNARETAKWLVLGAVIPALLGIWQFLTQTTFTNKWLGLVSHPAWQAGTSVIEGEGIGRWLRAYGTFSNPNVLGGYLIVVLIVSALQHLNVGIEQQSNTKTEQHDNVTMVQFGNRTIQYYFFISLFLYFLFLVSLFFTFSRSAWLAFGILWIGLVVSYLKNKNKTLLFNLSASVSLIIFLTIIFFPLIKNRTSTTAVSESRSVVERTVSYGEAWKMFKMHPILGVGVGNYTAVMQKNNPQLAGWQIQPVHNVFLLILCELGIVGIGLIVWLIGFAVSIKAIGLRHWPVLVLLPLLMFDHYLYSAYFGLILLAVFLGWLWRSRNVDFV